MFRHTALFLLRETTTPEQREAMLRGLASLLEECPTVLGGDFGARLGGAAGPGDFDVALHLDFEDSDGYKAYVAHPAHVEVSAFNASLSVPDTTARVDWRYDGAPRVSPGRARHCETFFWAGEPDEDAFEAAAALRGADGVLSALAVADSGDDPRAADWILDVELADEAAARTFVAGAAFRDFSAAVAQALDPARTARITHLQRPG